MAEKDFATICVVCHKGITHDELKYDKGRAFHPECHEKHATDFLVVNQDLLRRSARAKIELVQLKNLKLRSGGGSRKKSKGKPKRRTKKKAKRKTPRRTTKRKKAKKRQRRIAKRRVKRRTRRPTRKTRSKSRRRTRRRR